MSIYKRGDRWYASVAVGGQRLRRSLGPQATRAQARQLEAALRESLKKGLEKAAPHDLYEAATRWWELEGQHFKSASGRSQLRALIPFIKGKPLMEAPACAQDARQAWQSQGLKPGTISRRLGILKRICNLAYKSWGWLDRPIAEKIAMPKVNDARHVYITPEQAAALVQACPLADVADAIKLAAYTGLRKTELLRLLNGELAVRNQCIILDAQTKSGKPRVIPCAPPILDIIARLPLPMDRHRLYQGWDVARELCGLKHVRFHDLRHTFASWLVQSGASLKAVQELLGHADLNQTQRYAHLAPQHLVDAIDKLAVLHEADNVVPIQQVK